MTDHPTTIGRRGVETSKVRILALTKYGPQAASTRQRFMLYRSALEEAGYDVEFTSFFDDDHMRRLVDGESPGPLAIVRAYCRRIAQAMRARRYDGLWVYCEFFPYWPGFMERIANGWRKPIILDLDDAIFHNYDNSPKFVVRMLLGKKFADLLRTVDIVCCGNKYLRDYAARWCDNSIVLPTVVDTAIYRPIEPQTGAAVPVIGWIGSPSTWENVRPLLPLLADLCRNHGVRVMAVGAGTAAVNDQFDGLDLVEWSEASEVASVQAMDVGIMPLLDLPFQRGKSGYKLIQYMACGLPVVASPVGVNRDIVDVGANGFLATTVEEWRTALEALIDSPDLRRRMGTVGRAIAVERYSLASQAPRLVDLFRSVVPCPTSDAP